MKRFVLVVVLSFSALLSSALSLAAVDINTASESQLESLPGIGPGKAKAIIAERKANGPFKSVDDLGRVKGIADKTIAELRSQATVGASPPASDTKSVGQDSSAPGGHFPWGWVMVVLVATGATGWFFLRRRTSSATSDELPVPQQQSGPAPSGSVPKPTGPSSVGAPQPKPATVAGSPPPPAPAGPKPAARPAPAAARPSGGTVPPPAPAGSKRKDV